MTGNSRMTSDDDIVMQGDVLWREKLAGLGWALEGSLREGAVAVCGESPWQRTLREGHWPHSTLYKCRVWAILPLGVLAASVIASMWDWIRSKLGSERRSTSKSKSKSLSASGETEASRSMAADDQEWVDLTQGHAISIASRSPSPKGGLLGRKKTKKTKNKGEENKGEVEGGAEQATASQDAGGSDAVPAQELVPSVPSHNPSPAAPQQHPRPRPGGRLIPAAARPSRTPAAIAAALGLSQDRRVRATPPPPAKDAKGGLKSRIDALRLPLRGSPNGIGRRVRSHTEFAKLQ